MQKKFYIPFIVLLLAFAASITSCTKDDPEPDTTPNIMSVLKQDTEFSTLVQVIEKAGLDSTLSAAGAYTIFAPTNAAFSELFSSLGITLDDLNPEKLKGMLLYHAISGKNTSTQLASGYVPSLTKAAGSIPSSLFLKVDNGVMINNVATVTQANINAEKNGIIHKINKVLLEPTLADLVANNPNFSLLFEAAVKVGLNTELQNGNSITLFAPTNAAMQAALAANGFATVNDVPTAVLTNILQTHALGKKLAAADITATSTQTTINAKTLTITKTGTEITIDSQNTVGSKVTTADIGGTNGIIHIIDKVLLP